MKKSFKNLEMMGMLQELRPLLSHRDKVGYAAARNTRILTQSLTEYMAVRDRLIEKYGEPDRDKAGNETGTISLKMDSPNFNIFVEELEPFNDMQHEVELMTLRYEEVIGVLSGEEILSIDWMLGD